MTARIRWGGTRARGTIRHALQQIALIRGEQPAWAGGGGAPPPKIAQSRRGEDTRTNTTTCRKISEGIGRITIWVPLPILPPHPCIFHLGADRLEVDTASNLASKCANSMTAMSRSYLFISNLHRSLVTSSHSIRRMIHSRPQRSSRTALATLSLCSLLLGGAQGVCSNATGAAVNVPMALAAANFSHPGLSLVRHALQTSGRPRPRLDVHPPQRTAAAAATAAVLVLAVATT